METGGGGEGGAGGGAPGPDAPSAPRHVSPSGVPISGVRSVDESWGTCSMLPKHLDSQDPCSSFAALTETETPLRLRFATCVGGGGGGSGSHAADADTHSHPKKRQLPDTSLVHLTASQRPCLMRC